MGEMVANAARLSGLAIALAAMWLPRRRIRSRDGK